MLAAGTRLASAFMFDCNRLPNDFYGNHVRLGKGRRDALAGYRDANLDRRQLGSLAHGGPIQHISVFGFGPIPLRIFLGHLLDEKVAASDYNRVRTPQGWAGPKDGKRIKKLEVTLPSCKRGSEVGLMMSVTSQVRRAPVNKIGPATMPIFELDLEDPSLDCLRTPEELADFVAAGRNVMEQFHRVEATKVHCSQRCPSPLPSNSAGSCRRSSTRS